MMIPLIHLAHQYHRRGAPPIDFLQNFSNIIFEPREIIIGPDGNYWVLEGAETGDVDNGVPTGLVHRFNRAGGYIDEFISQSDFPNGDESKFMVSRSDGYLYIGTENGEILRYDAATGAFFDTFIDDLDETGAIAFDSDGNVYVAGSLSGDTIRKYDSDGNFLSVVIDPSEALYDETHGIVFRGDRLYVANQDNDNILVVTLIRMAARTKSQSLWRQTRAAWKSRFVSHGGRMICCTWSPAVMRER